jgi:hypothetical protein
MVANGGGIQTAAIAVGGTQGGGTCYSSNRRIQWCNLDI